MACLCRLQFFANCLAVGKSMALPTARQSAKPGSRQILLCRLQEIPVGKGTSLPSVEKKQLAKKIAVGKEPVSCSEMYLPSQSTQFHCTHHDLPSQNTQFHSTHSTQKKSQPKAI
jgi:hypothetical protein